MNVYYLSLQRIAVVKSCVDQQAAIKTETVKEGDANAEQENCPEKLRKLYFISSLFLLEMGSLNWSKITSTYHLAPRKVGNERYLCIIV